MLSVHVGLHKTGTTSIQAGLETSKGHISRRQAYLRWTDLFVTDGVINQAGVDRIRALGARGWHTVVSSEGALGPMTMSTVYPDAAPVVRQLDELFGDQGLRVIVYLRPQHEWAASAYSQYVRGGGALHPEDFVATMLEQPYLHHTALVDDMHRSLRAGQLVVRPYRAGMDVVSDFFDVAGLGPVPAFLGHQRANVSLSAEDTEALRRANENGGGAVTLLTPDDDETTSPVERSPLPEDCQVELHALFQRDWTELSAVVAHIAGHDPAAFLDAVDASRDWVPRPFAGPPPRPAASSSAAVAVRRASTEQAAPAASAMTERLHRLEFQLRHGPRQMLLKALMRAG